MKKSKYLAFALSAALVLTMTPAAAFADNESNASGANPAVASTQSTEKDDSNTVETEAKEQVLESETGKTSAPDTPNVSNDRAADNSNEEITESDGDKAGTSENPSVDDSSSEADTMQDISEENQPVMLAAPQAAVTVGAFSVSGGTEGTDFKFENNTLTILTATPLTIANVDVNTATTDVISVADGVDAKVTLAGVNINASTIEYRCAFLIGNKSAEITLTGTNILNSGPKCAGLQLSTENSKVTIQGDGTLYAYGKSGAGIGGGVKKTGEGLPGNHIYIVSGTIYAYGTAGIGGGTGGSGGSASDIIISGGYVTAVATVGSGAGIGGGYLSSGSNIIITGGHVVATASQGAGIGGGWYGSGSNITITGGHVETKSEMGAGIGGGHRGSGSDITITGGYVAATSEAANGIGGGMGDNSGSFQTQKLGEPAGNAVIFANGGYYGNPIGNQTGKTDTTNPWNGIIFEGDSGKVYGSVTPTEDFTIEAGKTLEIPENSTLNVKKNIYVDGTLTGTPAVDSTGAVYCRLIVNGAVASGNIVDYQSKNYSKAGTMVTLTKNNAAEGQHFSGWSLSNDTMTITDNTFTMPLSALTVTAQFADNSYIVTIPATATVGKTTTIKADDVAIGSDRQLTVKLTDANNFELVSQENAKLSYSIICNDKTLATGDTVLTVPGSDTSNHASADLTFTTPQNIEFAGEYTGSVIFTVEVQQITQ